MINPGPSCARRIGKLVISISVCGLQINDNLEKLLDDPFRLLRVVYSPNTKDRLVVLLEDLVAFLRSLPYEPPPEVTPNTVSFRVQPEKKE